jgi:hypothetical protein
MPLEFFLRLSDDLLFSARHTRRRPLSSDRIEALRTQEPEFVNLMRRAPTGPEIRSARIRFGSKYTRMHARIMYKSTPADH